MPHPVLDLDDSLELDEELGPATYPSGDDEEDEVYAVYSRAMLDERREAMESLFLTWTQNLLFLAGLQWWRFDRLMGGFGPAKFPKWKEQPVRNIILPYFKHVLAKLTKNRPRSTCIPASTDPEDIRAAKLGDDVLKSKWQELRLTKTLRRACAWLISTGNAYIMPYWNQDSGILMPLTTLVEAARFDSETGEPDGVEAIEVPCDENGEPILNEDGHYDTEAEPAYIDIGEIGYKALSPFQVFPDIGAECDEDVHLLLVAESLTLREIRRRWPDSGSIVGEDTTDVDRFDHLVSGLSAGADTHTVGGQHERNDQVPKAIVIHTFQEKSEQYPHGRHWVSVGRQLLERPGPLPDGIWPVVVHFKDVEVPGRYHGEATMTAAVGLQREYNEVNAQIKEHHNLLLRGKWLVPIGSNIRRGQITAEPGEVIQHTPGLPPTMADLKPLPQKVYDEREKILNDFEYITSAHRVSMGNPPPGVTSGRAFLVLQEADDSDFGPMLEMLEECVAELGWATLQIIQRYYEEERLVRISGDNHRYRARAFKGADLSAIVDVEPQAGSAFPWSKTALQSMMIDLAKEVPQLFLDPESGQFDHERFRRMLPVGGEDAVGEGSDIDITEALREEDEFEHWDGETEFPTIMPWQNHQVHLRQHSRILKSATFRKWDPEAQQEFIQHFVETQVEIQKMMEAQLAMQERAEASGRPSGGGGSEEPGGRGRNPSELSEAERDPVSG